jgi:RecJ-like exonuclease
MADVNQKLPSVKYATTVRSCPQCEGTGFFISPWEQYMDKPCSMCGGTRTVDTAKICYCGRPAIWKHKGYEICNQQSCEIRIDEYLEKEKQKKEVEEKAKHSAPPKGSCHLFTSMNLWEVEAELKEKGMNANDIADYIQEMCGWG